MHFKKRLYQQRYHRSRIVWLSTFFSPPPNLPGAPQSAQASFPGFCRISLKARVDLSFADISASWSVIPPLSESGRDWVGAANSQKNRERCVCLGFTPLLGVRTSPHRWPPQRRGMPRIEGDEKRKERTWTSMSFTKFPQQKVPVSLFVCWAQSPLVALFRCVFSLGLAERSGWHETLH